MQIVIDINDDTGALLNSEDITERLLAIDNLIRAFKDGTVLPEGHGDLIDRDKLEKDTEWSEYEDGCISYSHNQIFSEPAVIPADK